MKKLLLSLVAVCFLGLGVQAQEVFHKGDIVGNLQIGVGTYEGYGIGIPPTSISVDVGAFDNLIKNENGSIGLGGYYGIGTFRNVWKEDVTGIKYKDRTVRMCIGLRGTFHYQFVDNLDTYAGVMLGLYTYNHKHVVSADNNSLVQDDPIRTNGAGFAHSEFVGVRYYFNDSFGVGAEAGYGFTYVSAGITLKF